MILCLLIDDYEQGELRVEDFQYDGVDHQTEVHKQDPRLCSWGDDCGKFEAAVDFTLLQ